MINFDDVTGDNTKEHNLIGQIPDHPYRILIMRHSGSPNTNPLGHH